MIKMLRSLTVGRVVLVLAVAGVFGLAMGASTLLLGPLVTERGSPYLAVSTAAMAQPLGVADPYTDYICYSIDEISPPVSQVTVQHINKDKNGNDMFRREEFTLTLRNGILFCAPVVKTGGVVR